MRLTPAELRSWRRAAKKDDVPIAQWIRRLCNVAAQDRAAIVEAEKGAR